MKRTPVIIESPYKASNAIERSRNDKYLKACVLDSLSKNEAPFASHALYTQFLDDSDIKQRALGMEAGFVWTTLASKVVVYIDLGTTEGMRQGVAMAIFTGKKVETRSLLDSVEVSGTYEF